MNFVYYMNIQIRRRNGMISSIIHLNSSYMLLSEIQSNLLQIPKNIIQPIWNECNHKPYEAKWNETFKQYFSSNFFFFFVIWNGIFIFFQKNDLIKDTIMILDWMKNKNQCIFIIFSWELFCFFYKNEKRKIIFFFLFS